MTSLFIKLLASILLVFANVTNAQFKQIPGVTYTAMANPDSGVAASLAACEAGCKLSCDFYHYDSATKICSYQTTDKSAFYSTTFKYTSTSSVYIIGEITGLTPIAAPTVTSQTACANQCENTIACDFAVINQNGGKVKCALYKFAKSATGTLGFKTYVDQYNANPTTKGKFDLIGNTGIVAISQTLLPNGKILVASRPEKTRGM